MASQGKTEEKASDDDESSSVSSDTDSEDEFARTMVPDDDPRWQKVTYDNGVKKIILREGWGRPAPDGSDAYIRYVGKFKDSQRVFEDNTAQSPPFKFLVGHFRVIRAIDIAVAAMKIGEKCLLRTSSRYAFGEKGEGRKIAPNKDLDYELEVVDWDDWKRVNNRDEVVKRVLKQGEGDMYDVPDASAICDVTYTAQSFEDEKYPGAVFSSGRHIEVMVDEDPTLPEGFHEALKSMNKYEMAEFKILPQMGFGDKGVPEVGVKGTDALYYRVQMHNYQNLMSRWKMEPLQLMDVGQRFKQKARQYYDLGHWDYAFQRYEKALEYFEAEEKMDWDEKRQAKDEVAKVHNNLAMIHLRRNEFKDCVRECNKVLQHDKDNVKAWCRKGQARMMTAEYRKAKECLSYALSLDEGNRFIKRMLRENRKKKRKYKATQKELYGNMFDRYNEEMARRRAMSDKMLTGPKAKPKKTVINIGDIDDYQDDDGSSIGSIDFDFDDMDDGTSADGEYDDDSDDSSVNSILKGHKKNARPALSCISEDQ